MTNSKLSADFFPIQTDRLSQLYAYKIVGDDNVNTVGGKLSYRLRKNLSGNWVWSNYKLISDTQKSEADFQEVLSTLRKNEPDTFGNLHKVLPIDGWHPSVKEIADYVAWGVLPKFSYKIENALRKDLVNLGKADVERDYEIRGWSVQGEPAISLSISSNIIYKGNLAEYVQTINDPDELIGIWVKVKTQDFKGEIVEIVGTVEEHRKRLLEISRDEKAQQVIQKASPNELVVKIISGQNRYDYVASALNPILKMGDLHRFGVNSKEAMNAFRLAPATRNKIVTEVTKCIKSEGLTSYNSIDHPQFFLTTANIQFVPKLRFGNNQVADSSALMQNLRKYGVYRRNKRFENSPITIGILDARKTKQTTTLARDIKEELSKLDFEMEFVGKEQLSSLSRVEFERAVDALQLKNPDVLIALLPGSQGEADEDDNEEDESIYRTFKSLTIGQDIQSQVIYESTLSNSYAVQNIVLGIIGKTGNIPFILAEPLPYADLVVGIDVARKTKARLPGSINSTAVARIYFNNGDFLRYKIHDVPIEGETIPDMVLKSLFPIADFKGKKVVIHRDGFFRGNERKILTKWAEEIGAEFYLVEILKSGAPRIYLETNGEIRQPPTGRIFKISDREALLISSLPPFSNATPRPLQIRCDDSISVEHALHSVLSLTLLHYGSVRPPRLPVTVHYSDKIGYLALRGIKPKTLEGTIPFWL